MECLDTAETRNLSLKNILHEMPMAMRNELDAMNSESQTRFLLSGLGEAPIVEWQNIYRIIVYFVCTMYTQHKRLYIDFNESAM